MMGGMQGHCMGDAAWNREQRALITFNKKGQQDMRLRAADLVRHLGYPELADSLLELEIE